MRNIFARNRSKARTACIAAALVLASSSAFATESCVGEQKTTISDERSVDDLIASGESLMASGIEARGVAQLAQAAQLAEQIGEPEDKARAFGAYGHGLMLTGDKEDALACLDESLKIAAAHGLDDLEAMAHLNKGTLYAPDRLRGREARRSFDQARKKAEEAGRPDIAARALLNSAKRAASFRGKTDDIVRDLKGATRIIDTLEQTPEKASLLLALGVAWSDASPARSKAFAYDQDAFTALSRTLNLAKDLDLPRLQSSSLGHMADLYYRQGRSNEALTLLDQAVIEARQIRAGNLLYRWYSRRALIARDQDQRAEALHDYALAVDAINDLRADAALRDSVLGVDLLSDAQGLFTDYLSFLFADDVDLLAQDELRRIQEIVEQQRQVEVESYFQDDCVADLRSRVSKIQENPEPGTAFFYPIFLGNRLLLLANIGGQLRYEQVPLNQDELSDDVKFIRRSLEVSNSTEAEYLPILQRWHSRLIAPVEEALRDAEIDTLVIVPTGLLRGLPFAALHNGDTFLIRRYALAIAPGLSLLESTTVVDPSFETLLGGLTKSVPGFQDLKFANDEVELIRSIRGGDVLKDDLFARQELQQSLAEIPYTVVHLASHAKFGGNREDTFIVTQDGNIDLDQLEALIRPSAFRERPVELLTLSACETAKGNELEQAALGLAGIAVKAGARSALGTLWPVFDVSSPEFMAAFYRNIGPRGLSKAKALREAQLSMLDSDQFNHPAFWAPYLLVGNWL